MKKYILTGMALLVVSTTASENPFDLKENFGQLEQDQEVLLSELKKIAELKELAEEQELAEEEARELASGVIETELPREDLPTVEIDDIVTSSDTQSIDIPNQVEEENIQVISPQDTVVPSEEKLNVMRQKSLEASRTEALPKAVQSKEAELKKAKQEASQVAEAKKEAEMREVEAYEKKRAERLARKVAEAAAPEKEALVQKEAKDLAAETAKQAAKVKETAFKQVSKAPTAKKQTVAVKNKIDMGKSEDQTKSTVKVIDVKREKEDAKIAADKAYEEAVKEMSQEETISL